MVRSIVSDTGFGSAATTARELQAHPNDRIYALRRDRSSGSSSQPMLEEVYRTLPAIGRLAQLAQNFFRMLKERDLQALPAWLEAAYYTALASLAAGLERDIDAVREALRLP